MTTTALIRTGLLSPGRFLGLATASCVALFLVVTSGAFVRLTGSGLGCENWPRCGDKPYPEQGYHAFVEFGNRMVALIGIVLTLGTWLGGRKLPGLSGIGRGAALGAFLVAVALIGIVLTLATWLGARKLPGLSGIGRGAALGAFLVAVAQIPMGGITIALDLHPLAVMTHFLLGLAVLGFAVVVVLEAWSLVGGLARPAGPGWLRAAVTWLGVPACAALVVTGAVATASGPHPGADENVKRLGLEIRDTVYVHVRVAAVFGIGVLVLGWFLWRLRGRYPGLLGIWGALLAVLVAQAVLGEIQYRNALPWGLVLVHVFLAAAIWTASLALAFALRRPPAALARE